MATRYTIEEYITEDGKTPFRDWVNHLKDQTAQRKIAVRLRRTSFGNFGDCKRIKGVQGLWEMREHFGGGYRIYYSLKEKTMVLLLAGSTKKDQTKAIAQAKGYLADFERRHPHD
ncbi:MAG: addiction module killer protein [Nitrospirales bacterium]|nr:MAG: addiction module killer protein [Nitrospirales bacterium]